MRIRPISHSVPLLELQEILFARRGRLLDTLPEEFQNTTRYYSLLFKYEGSRPLNGYAISYGHSFGGTYATGQWEVAFPELDYNYLTLSYNQSVLPFEQKA